MSSGSSNESELSEDEWRKTLPISGKLTLTQELTALVTYFVPHSRSFLGVNSTSPQRQALEWLATNENLNSYPLWKRLQRYALATLYYSTNGDDWFLNNDWLSDNDECTWRSRNLLHPACDGEGRMQSLFLNKNGLNGTIPVELSLLSDSLKDFQLAGGAWGCQLVGTIPSELSSMTNLVSIHLESNRLEGTFPSGLERLTSLETLHLDSNRLKGPIPSDIGALSSLQRFTIGNNALTGFLPSQLALITSLKEAKLHSNDLTGDIPTQMGLVTTLNTLWLFENKHSGAIPTEVGLLRSLKDLRLHENLLDGSLPSELGVLSSLTTLKLSSNSIGDAIPSQIGSLSGLEELNLAANRFTGTISSSFGNLSSLRGTDRCTVLSAAGVDLSCEVIYPSPLDRYVGGLWLHGNRLAGSIPEDLQLLTDLRVLTLFGNKLNGKFDCPDVIEHCLVSCAKSDPGCRVLKPGLLSTLTHLAFDG
jgi:Leucine-rich repeat (LRR) protein